MADGIININGDSVQTLEIIYLMTLFTLLPSAVILMTSFTRYVISLSFLRNAMGTQQVPPNMVLVGLSLFLTLFTMGPVVREISSTAYQPYLDGEISKDEAVDSLKKETRHYAKRQLTWLRSMGDDVTPIKPDDPSVNAKIVLDLIKSK